MVAKSAVKDLVALQRLAEEQGWTVEYSGGGHLKWVPPFGDYYTSSSTPTSQRTIDNIKAELKARGMIVNRGEWRRYKRESSSTVLAAIASITESGQILGPDIDHDKYNAVIDAARANNIRFSTENANPTPELVEALYRLILDDDNFQLTCECNRQFVHPLGMVKHIEKCEVHLAVQPDPTPTDEEAAQMKRNMAAPPARERLNCPECPKWYWISEPGALAEHVRGEHGQEACPYCERYFRVPRGITKHVNTCVKNPSVYPKPEPREVVEPEPEPVAVNGKGTSTLLNPKSGMPYKAQPHRYPTVAKVDGLGDYDPRKCTWCGRPRGQMRGASTVCWNPVCWEQTTKYFSERGLDVELAHKTFIESPLDWIRANLEPEARGPIDKLEAMAESPTDAAVEADLDAAQQIMDELLAETEAKAKKITDAAHRDAEKVRAKAESMLAEAKRKLAEVESFASSRPPAPGQPLEAPVLVLPDDATDDDLWGALAAIVGQMPMNKDSFVAVGTWMEATRHLLGMRAK